MWPECPTQGCIDPAWWHILQRGYESVDWHYENLNWSSQLEASAFYVIIKRAERFLFVCIHHYTGRMCEGGWESRVGWLHAQSYSEFWRNRKNLQIKFLPEALSFLMKSLIHSAMILCLPIEKSTSLKTNSTVFLFFQRIFFRQPSCTHRSSESSVSVTDLWIFWFF